MATSRSSRVLLFASLLTVAGFSPAVATPLFLVQEQAGNDLLLRFDAGTLTTVGSIGFGDVRGLAYDPLTDTLYGLSRTSDRLITIDMTTGAGTAVSTNPFLPGGSNTAEMTFDEDGDLFALGRIGDMTGVDTLFSVDETTGVASTIGSLGIPLLSGLAFDPISGGLFGTTFNGDLYSVNATTGAATFLGPIAGTTSGVARIAFDPSGTLFGITSGLAVPKQLVTIDLSTFAATQVAQFSGNQMYALDFAPQPVPEPSTLVISALGLLLVAARLRKRT
jgi:outer membrane protein assembly factor BamB